MDPIWDYECWLHWQIQKIPQHGKPANRPGCKKWVHWLVPFFFRRPKLWRPKKWCELNFWFVSNQEMPRSCNSGKIIITILLRDLNWPSLSIVAVVGQDPNVSTCSQHAAPVGSDWRLEGYGISCGDVHTGECSNIQVTLCPARIMGVSPEFTEWSLILINQNMLYSLTIVKLLDILYCTCMLKSPPNIEAVLCGLGAACSHWFLDESQVDYVGGSKLER